MSAKYWYGWIGAAAVAGIVVAASLELAAHRTQHTAEDMSCHNAFRDTSGTAAIRPKLAIDLDIMEQDWPVLTRLLEKFAGAHRWSFRDASVRIPGKVNAINLNLCSEDWQMILVSENHWRGTHAHDQPGRGLGIALYADVEPLRWQQSARDLVRVLNKKWPGRVRFRDRDGYLLGRPPSYLEQGEFDQ